MKDIEAKESTPKSHLLQSPLLDRQQNNLILKNLLFQLSSLISEMSGR